MESEGVLADAAGIAVGCSGTVALAHVHFFDLKIHTCWRCQHLSGEGTARIKSLMTLEEI